MRTPNEWLQNLSIWHKEILLVGIPLIFELSFLIVLAMLLGDAERQVVQESQSKSLIADVKKLNYLFGESGVSTAAYTATRNAEQAKHLDVLRSQMNETLNSLKEKTANNRDEHELLLRVEKLMARQYEFQAELKKMFEKGGGEFDLLRNEDLYQEAVYLADQTNSELNRLANIEEETHKDRPYTARRARDSVLIWLGAGVALNILIALLLTQYFTKETVSRLQLLMANMELLTARQPLKPPLAGKDEIAQVDSFFHKMADQLEELDRVKRDFFAMASHDLRSPLSSVRLFLISLREGVYGPISDKAESRASAMERTTMRVVGLVNDLLDLEKLEQGKLDVDPKPAQLKEIIEQSVESVRDLADVRLIDIAVLDCNLVVLADSERLIQVAINLLSNAIKFSPEGSTITIATVEEDEFARVGIADEGPGIPEDLQELVFERFKQLHVPGESRKSGTGLGLPICKEIIKLHRGAIGVERNPVRGSTFWFKVPIA
jgi:signal transduction histidine kinase